MDYQNTLKYLYESAPMFQQIGGKAYKPGLENNICVNYKIFLSSHDFLDFNVDICSLIHQSSVYSWNDGSKDKQFCEQ